MATHKRNVAEPRWYIDDDEPLDHPDFPNEAIENENEPLDHPSGSSWDEEEVDPPTDEQLWDATVGHVAEENGYEAAYRRIIRDPTSRNGIYLTRLILSLYDGARWPYPLQPTLAGLSEECRHIAIEIIYLYFAEGPEGIVHWAEAVALEFPFYEQECRLIAELYRTMDEAVLALVGEAESER